MAGSHRELILHITKTSTINTIIAERNWISAINSIADLIVRTFIAGRFVGMALIFHFTMGLTENANVKSSTRRADLCYGPLSIY